MNLRVLDFFSGMGGFSFGFQKANFQIENGYDHWEVANQTYSKHIGVEAKNIDISDFFPSKKDYEILIVGGSPCQDFSRLNNSKDIYSKRAQLVLDFCRIVNSLKPEIFVFENVIGFPKWGESALMGIPKYKVSKNIINTKYLGIPQERRRKIYIGSRNTTIKISNPLIYKIRTVRECLAQLTENWGFVNHRPPTIEKFSKVKNTSWHNVENPDGYEGIIRLNWDSPACAITNVKKAQILHPSENRVISIAEALLLQDFPEWYIPEGTDTDKAQQIANAVPPTLSYYLATEIKKRLKKSTI